MSSYMELLLGPAILLGFAFAAWHSIQWLSEKGYATSKTKHPEESEPKNDLNTSNETSIVVLKSALIQESQRQEAKLSYLLAEQQRNIVRVFEDRIKTMESMQLELKRQQITELQATLRQKMHIAQSILQSTESTLKESLAGQISEEQFATLMKRIRDQSDD
jgi:hypothetical protein